MKLNPFSKKSSAYYEKVKADHNKLNHELAGIKKQLETAEAEHEREQAVYDRIRESAGRYSLNPTEKQSRQHQVLSEVYNRVGQLKSDIAQLGYQMAPLHRIVEAPEQYAQAKKSLEDLRTHQSALTGDLDKTDALLTRVNKRIADLDVRIASETKSAAQNLLNEEGEFVVPEALTKLDVELRLGKASLAELQAKRKDLVAQLGELPMAIRDAEHTFITYRAVIAEIELQEQLMPIMDLFARAALARHQHVHSHSEHQYEIEIPHELIERAEAALAAELTSA